MGIINIQHFRSTSQNGRDKDGYFSNYATNAPVTEFNFDGSYRGISIEPQRTNYLQYSEDFTSVWTASITPDTLEGTAPDGSPNTTRFQEGNTTEVYHGVNQSHSLGAGTYTFSVWAKKKERNHCGLMIGSSGFYNGVLFDLTTGQVTLTVNEEGLFQTANSEQWVDGWWRVEIKFAIASPTTIFHRVILAKDATTWKNYVPTTGYSAYFFGAQAEAGDFASSYMKTESTTTTRNSGFMQSLNISGVLGNSNTGATVYLNWQSSNSVTGLLLRILSSTDSALFDILQQADGDVRVTIYGDSQVVYTFTPVGDMHNLAVSYVVGAIGLAYNGQYIFGSTATITNLGIPDKVYLGGFSQGILTPNANYRGASFEKNTSDSSRLIEITKL